MWTTRAAMGIEREAPARTIRYSIREKFAKILNDLRIFGKLINLLGLRGPTAAPFWRNAFRIKRRNPSRLVQYFMSCSFAANLFMLRDEIQLRAKKIPEN